MFNINLESLKEIKWSDCKLERDTGKEYIKLYHIESGIAIIGIDEKQVGIDTTYSSRYTLSLVENTFKSILNLHNNTLRKGIKIGEMNKVNALRKVIEL